MKTMNKIGKLENLKLEMHRLEISETRWKEQKEIKCDNVYMVYSGHKNCQEGVTVVIDTQAEKLLTLTKIYNTSVMMARFANTLSTSC